MGFNFPNSPLTGDIVTPPGGPSYQWNGYGWAQLAGEASGVPEAPLDGLDYVRKNAAWNVLPVDIADWATITSKPATFPPTLPIPSSGVTGLDAALAGKVDKAGDTMTGQLTVLPATGVAGYVAQSPDNHAFLALLKGASGKYSYIDGAVGTSGRWRLALGDNTAESTGNAGSNFVIYRFSDAGAQLDASLSINRATNRATFLGQVDIGATALISHASLDANIFLRKGASGRQSIIYGQTGAFSRWTMSLGNTAAETGDPAGSDFQLVRYNDAGTALDSPIVINRIDGIVDMVKGATAATPTAGDNSTNVATTAFVATAATAKVSKAGDTMTGNLTIAPAAGVATAAITSADSNATVSLQKGASGSQNYMDVRTGVGAAGLRWRWTFSDTTAEGGSDAGSNFGINAYSDTGGFLFAPISITRSTGLLSTRAITTTGTITASGSNVIAAGGAIQTGYTTAIPAGGAATLGFKGTSTGNFGVFFGSGAPTLTAAKGSLYLRSDGSTTNDRMYVNTNGAATWTAVNTVA